MKSIPFFVLISWLLLFMPQQSNACISPYYHPAYYFTFRVYDDNSDHTQEEENCRLWQQLTGSNIPLADIHEVVYKWSYEETKNLGDISRDYFWTYSDNKFENWIQLHNDREIADFLILAKLCEKLRARQKDPWYYPVEGDSIRISLDQIAEKALAYKGDRLKDRYMLQAIRALFASYRYDDCINLWNDRISQLPDGLIKQMIIPYVAGCYFRTGDSEKAISLYASCGDMNSIVHCLGKKNEEMDPVDLMILVHQYAPHYTNFNKTVQQIIHQLEYHEGEANYDYRKGMQYNINKVDSLWQKSRKLYNFAVKLANHTETSNRDMWYYTAAYLADKLGMPTEALNCIRQARHQKNNPYMQASVQVLTIYLEAKYLPYTNEYEQRLIGQLKWFEEMIYNHLDQELITDIGIWKMNAGYSYYYWNDMLRKILLSVVAPRYMQMGQGVRAIQVTNMADNLLFRKMKQKDPSSNFMEVIRNSTIFKNQFDYQSYLFQILDTIDIKHIIAYTTNLQQPESAFSHYINGKGYNNPAYFNDIIGTKFLLQTDYAQAAKYLEKVPAAFQYTLNTSKDGYMKRNPFQPDAPFSDQSDYKLNFAREMLSLQQRIEQSTDPNRKAQWMIRYANGMLNSYDHCWALTQYYKSSFYGNYESDTSPKRKEIKKKYDRIIQKALSSFTDKEAAAQAYWRLGYYKKVVRDYPSTAMVEYAKAHCDNLQDYICH